MCAVLRGERPGWPGTDDPTLVDAFLERSEYHGVQALLYERLHDASDWPPALLDALHRQAIAGTMWELRHQQVVAEMLAELARVGIEPVLFKGTALAYSLYPGPALRTRGDTDLIVPFHERTRAMDALGCAGFCPRAGTRRTDELPGLPDARGGGRRRAHPRPALEDQQLGTAVAAVQL
jgi:hypothetical protein